MEKHEVQVSDLLGPYALGGLINADNLEQFLEYTRFYQDVVQLLKVKEPGERQLYWVTSLAQDAEFRKDVDMFIELLAKDELPFTYMKGTFKDTGLLED